MNPLLPCNGGCIWFRHCVQMIRAWDGGIGRVAGWGAQGLGLSSQLLAAPILRPVRRTRQARVVVVFQGCSLAGGGGWGFRAGLTEPLSGHGALLRGAGGDRACLTGRGWFGMRAIVAV